MRVTLLLLVALASFAAAPPLQFAGLGDVPLVSGDTIHNCKLGYRTYGTLNADKSNAILIPTWFTGTSEQLDPTVRSLFKPEQFYVITVDAIGNGVSCSPSNSTEQPRLKFPKFTIRDMVNAEHTLVTEHLGLTRLHAVAGISMGGMQTFEWAIAYPDFMERAIPIVGSPRLAASDVILWTAEARAIQEHKDFHNGDYTTPPAMSAVAATHQFALTTPAHMAREKPAPEKPETRMEAVDWLRQLQAMLAHDVAPGTTLQAAARNVKAKMLIVVASQDHMVNPIPARDFAIGGGIPLFELTGDCGHLAPGCEGAALARAVGAFLP